MLFLAALQGAVLALLLFTSWRGVFWAALGAAFFPALLPLPGKAAFLFGMGPLVAYGTGRYYRRMEQAFLERYRQAVGETEGRFRRKKEAFEQRQTSGQVLEERVGRIVALYELTKKMTATLEMSETFLILQEALRGNLSFDRGWLFLVSEKEAVLVREGQFCFSAETEVPLQEAGVSEPPPLLESLIGEVARQRKPLRLEKAFAVPLLVKSELNGCLVLEEFPPAQEESLLILASQFAPAIQKVRLYEKIQQLAITDGLTRLSSRHYFMERFQEELARSRRYHLTLAFLMADIDHFKEHNDRSGHLVGDVVLREVASLIKGSVREIDLVGRYGGEEFAIVLPDTPLEGALQVAERIRSTVEGHSFVAYDETLRVTLSLGISVYPENGEDTVTLIDTADSALYHAKHGGRNRVATSRMLA